MDVNKRKIIFQKSQSSIINHHLCNKSVRNTLVMSFLWKFSFKKSAFLIATFSTLAPCLEIVFYYTANVLTVENADVSLRVKFKYKYELYSQSIVCGAGFFLLAVIRTDISLFSDLKILKFKRLPLFFAYLLDIPFHCSISSRGGT